MYRGTKNICHQGTKTRPPQPKRSRWRRRHKGLWFVLGIMVSLWREEKSFTPKGTNSTIEEPMEVIRWLDYR
jgi:hypothetical protein